MRDAAARWPSWWSRRAIATRGATACGLLRLRLGLRLRVGVSAGLRVGARTGGRLRVKLRVYRGRT
jgi:hypothetical protein